MNGLYAPTFRIFTGQIKQNLFIGQKCFPPVEGIKDKFCVNLAKHITVDLEHAPANLEHVSVNLERVPDDLEHVPVDPEHVPVILERVSVKPGTCSG